jgi:protein-S-isoprenylcysteine O-methyltransferase Ste14
MEHGFFERGGGWVLGQTGLMVAVLAAGPLTRGGWRGGWVQEVAWGLFAAGAVLGIAGVWVLRGNRTIFPRPQAGSRLVTAGIYRWVRHPLYASLMCLSAGWGLWWASWPTLGMGLVLTVFLRMKAGREERWLAERFPEYPQYAARVRRFIPGWW